MARALASLLLISACMCMVRALECLPLRPTNISCDKVNRLGNSLQAYCRGTRFDNAFWASSQQPFASALPREYNAEVDFFQKTFAQTAELAMRKRHTRYLRGKCDSAYGRLEDGSTNRNWYATQVRWRDAAIRHQARIGLPEPDSICFTRIQYGVSKSRAILARMAKLNEAFQVTGKKLVESARKKVKLASFFDRQIGCWKHVVSPMRGTARTNALQCTVMHTVGFRRHAGGKFNLGASLTNAPPTESRSEKERHYLAERWTYDEKKDIVRAVPIPSYVRGDVHGLRNDTTTALFTWGGNVQVSYFLGIPTAQGPAMRRVNEATSHLQDSIHDGIAASNIAILIFPGFLAMIPISTFEFPSLEGKLSKVMVYSALTDVVAVLPLFIKGAELLVLATRKHTRCTAWTVGVEGNGVAVIELWCADCVHHSSFQKYGAVFIVVALVFSVLGVALEILAFTWVRRKRRHMRRADSKWWERTGITQDVCTEYECCRFQCEPAMASYSSTNSHRNAYFSYRRRIGGGVYDIN